MLCITLCSLIIVWVAGLKCFWMTILNIYLKEKDFCISRQTSQSESYFPTKYYHGITMYFDPDFLQKPTPMWIIFLI